jgi:hypothetical protein
MKAMMAQAIELCDAIDHMSGEVKFDGNVEFTDREKELIRHAAHGAVQAAHAFLSRWQVQIRTLAIAYEKSEKPLIILPKHMNENN